MTPDAAGKAIDTALNRLQQAANTNRSEQIAAATNRAMTAIYRLAAATGDSIMIGSRQSHNLVTLTVQGRNAYKYKALLDRALAESLPAAKATIRTELVEEAR
jgi:4-hydroxy-3-methylbut-2-enyl diphosphate reductase IspH